MEKAFIILVIMFISTFLMLLFGSRKRSIRTRKSKVNLKQKMKRGFISGFLISFVFISAFTVYLIYIKQYNSGSFSSFISFNILTSFFVAIIFSLVSAISTQDNGEIDSIKAKGIVGLFGIGLIIIGMIFI